MCIKINMEIIHTKITEVKILKPCVFSDNRGWFYESFNERSLKDAGINFHVIQENHIRFIFKNTIRGLHFQCNPYAQAKIVRCTVGSVLDVAVDLRKNHPTYLKWVSVELSAINKMQFFIPKGFAHGVMSIENNSEIQYCVDEIYSPINDRSVKFDDPQIGLVWSGEKVILSDKDRNAPLLKDSDCNF